MTILAEEDSIETPVFIPTRKETKEEAVKRLQVFES